MAGQYLYHGTSDKFLAQIEKSGLCPTAKTGERMTYWTKAGKNVLWREDAVYTTPSLATAWSLADQTVTSRGGKQVVIAFYSSKFSKPAGCRVQRRVNEVNFIGCGCIPSKILAIQQERPHTSDLIYAERSKSPAGRWERL